MFRQVAFSNKRRRIEPAISCVEYSDPVNRLIARGWVSGSAPLQFSYSIRDSQDLPRSYSGSSATPTEVGSDYQSPNDAIFSQSQHAEQLAGSDDRLGTQSASALARDNGFKAILAGRTESEISMGKGAPLLAEQAYEPEHIKGLHRKLSHQFSVLEFDNRNCRPAMEDWVTVAKIKTDFIQGSFFVVCDGHGIRDKSDAENASRKIARNAAEQMPIVFDECLRQTEGDPVKSLLRATKRVDEGLRGMPEAVRCGTTMTALLLADGRLYISNVGDSRAIVCGNRQADQLTVDHNMSNVRPQDVERMERHGVTVARGRAIVPNYGGLALSRTLGNFGHAPGKNEPGHRGGVSSTPDVFEYQLLPHDQFVVMGCDGVWDVLKNTEVAQLICDCRTAKDAAALIITTVKARGTSDNVSVVVIKLPD